MGKFDPHSSLPASLDSQSDVKKRAIANSSVKSLLIEWLRWHVCEGAVSPPKLATNRTVSPAQVPCKDIILHARASGSKKVAVQKLAQIPLTHSESGVHKVFSETGCKLDVVLDYVDLPTQKAVPYVKLSNWVKFLSRTGRLQYLVGSSNGEARQRLCREFWHRWSFIRPNHPIFKMATENKLRLEDCVPLLHHGDEGRTFRKSPIMIISTHGFLGKGSSQSKIKKNQPVEDDPMLRKHRDHQLYLLRDAPHALQALPGSP